ncbi:hypothetical protein D8B22_19965 [Verminephrobacter aporrectodeae subsp. tuberculatae]|uniref:hypothetical protein n=1 Tax=Verminephrobacter aporrectodeae TaxID=1110389 RepID=UPI002243415E|nr:hypothetical protein [Verminephrobacter aporrectodeae]MCW8167073.1 hypothetical protein [Verminephrobacter aporrectodeae subsp. tuberculatae]MCW8171316.1 hypothetical protein [Verminephrobacter aporrectodeae subsp. tuberculatae]
MVDFLAFFLFPHCFATRKFAVGDRSRKGAQSSAHPKADLGCAGCGIDQGLRTTDQAVGDWMRCAAD